MTDNFDAALKDLGFESFHGKNFFDFALQREDHSTIGVSLFRDQAAGVLRISACTSNTLPACVSSRFFTVFANAALEPLRGGIGVGQPENNEHLCVYFCLPMGNYQSGYSVLVLEKLIEQVEIWDELLPFAGR